jgi:sn-glycerol 3-phosphate transport system permease protein
VRIFPTVEVIANLKMLDSYAGLTLPLMASATATFLFRQFFMTLPDELIEAARIDGASPMRFFAISCCRCRKPIWRRCLSSPLSTAGTSICGRC